MSQAEVGPERVLAAEFRTVMGRFATGVTVVTAVQDGFDHAMTANSFASVSLDPPLVLVCVEVDSRFHEAVLDAGGWNVNVLDEAQRGRASWFATKGRPLVGQFDSTPTHRSALTGALLLDGPRHPRVPHPADPPRGRPRHPHRRGARGRHGPARRPPAAVVRQRLLPARRRHPPALIRSDRALRARFVPFVLERPERHLLPAPGPPPLPTGHRTEPAARGPRRTFRIRGRGRTASTLVREPSSRPRGPPVRTPPSRERQGCGRRQPTSGTCQP